MQTVPATAQLGPGKTGLAIGYRVLNLDGTTYSAFSTTGVAETSVAGTYRKTGGVVCPDAGAYIVWGVSGTDYAEATVESTAVNVTMQAGVAVAAADANGNVPVDVQTWRGGMPNELSAGAVSATVLTAVDVNLTSLVGVTEAIVKARGTIAVSSSWQQDVITSGTALNNTNSSYTRSLDNQPWSIGESQNIDVYASFVVPTGTAAQAVVVRTNVSLGSGTYVYISTDAETWINIGQLSYAMEQGEVKTIVVPSTVPAAGEDMQFLVRFNAGYYQNLQLDIDYCVLICNAPTTTIDQQDIADALLLAPAGAAAAGSAMAELAAILEDTGTTLPGLIAGVGAGSGTGYYSDILESPLGTPVDGARVTLTTDDDGENVAYEARTDAFGVFEMRPDPGTYYRFIEAASHTFAQGVEVEVTEP